MSDDEPPALTADEMENLNKLLDLNATHARQRFTDLAATWGVGGLQNELNELVKGLRVGDRPQVALDLGLALGAYLAQFGPEGVVGQADTYRDHG